MFEFPVTDDDELRPTTYYRAQSAIRLAEKIARYGGCYRTGSPNALGWKVQKAFYDDLKDEAWFVHPGISVCGGLPAMSQHRHHAAKAPNGLLQVNVPKRMEGLAIMLPIRSTPVGGHWRRKILRRRQTDHLRIGGRHHWITLNN